MISVFFREFNLEFPTLIFKTSKNFCYNQLLKIVKGFKNDTSANKITKNAKCAKRADTTGFKHA